MSEPSLSASAVITAVHGTAGELASVDADRSVRMPRLDRGAPLAQHQERLADAILTAGDSAVVRPQRDQVVVKVRGEIDAVLIGRVLARYGARLLLSPWGGEGRHRVGVVVGVPSLYMPVIREDLYAAFQHAPLLGRDAWMPTIRPLAGDAWELLSHSSARRPASPDPWTTLATTAEVHALVALAPSAAPDDTPDARTGWYRPSDSVLGLWPLLYEATGALPLVLSETGDVEALVVRTSPSSSPARRTLARYLRTLTPWDAARMGLPVTARVRSDILALDLDRWTAADAALIVAARHGLRIVVARSGSVDGAMPHLTGLMRIDALSRDALAEEIAAEEIRICDAHGLPRPNARAARTGDPARHRPPGSGTAKAGRAVGYGLAELIDVAWGGYPSLMPLTPTEVPAVLGIGTAPSVLPPAWVTGAASVTVAGGPGMAGVPAGRTSVVAVTADDAIDRWDLHGDAAQVLRATSVTDLPARDGDGADTSDWLWRLLKDLARRGATDDEVIAVVESASWLQQPGATYKTKVPGTAGMASRIRGEYARAFARVEAEAEADELAGDRPRTAPSPALVARIERLWAGWEGDPAELVTAARLLAVARSACRTRHVGIGVERMGYETGCRPGTAAERLTAMRDAGAITLVAEGYVLPSGRGRTDRYDLPVATGAPARGRPPLDVVLALQDARLCWVRAHLVGDARVPGMTSGALLVAASASHAGTIKIGDLMTAWGWDRRQAKRHAARLAKVGLVDVDGDTITWRDVDLRDVITATGAARAYATAKARAQGDAARRRGERPVNEPTPVGLAAVVTATREIPEEARLAA